VGKLTHEERCKIEVLHKAGVNAATIATQIGRHKSTVSRELERNSVDGIYQYNQATLLAKTRRSTCGGRSKLTEENWTYVRVLLYMKWSPEQISGWLKANPGIGFYVSDQWIYEYIRKNQFNGGDLYESLRRKGRPYRTGKFRPYRGKIKDRIAIDERPEIVEKRIRIGDWEVDSVIGKLNKSSLVTLVERVSRYTAILRVNSKEAMQACRLLVKDFAHPCAKSTRFKRQPFLPRPPSSPALTHLKNKRDAQALKWLYAAERFLSAITLATERGR